MKLRVLPICLLTIFSAAAAFAQVSWPTDTPGAAGFKDDLIPSIPAEPKFHRLVSFQEPLGEPLEELQPPTDNATFMDDSWGPYTGINYYGACGWTVGADLLFLKYHRADGVRIGTSGPGEVVDFDYVAAPRLSLAYTSACGTGVRARWFDYEDFAPGPMNQGLGVDTYLVDLEIFQTLMLSPVWNLQVSGGVRYVDFLETMRNGGGGAEVRINDIEAFGGLFGVRSTHALAVGAMYGRARFSVLSGDKFHRNDNTPVSLVLTDSVVGITEFGVGYEVVRPVGHSALLAVRFGGEWQRWNDFSTEFFNTAPGGENSGGPSDVGLIGFVLETGLYY